VKEERKGFPPPGMCWVLGAGKLQLSGIDIMLARREFIAGSTEKIPG
jgi:hypothetical protein